MVASFRDVDDVFSSPKVFSTPNSHQTPSPVTPQTLIEKPPFQPFELERLMSEWEQGLLAINTFAQGFAVTYMLRLLHRFKRQGTMVAVRKSRMSLLQRYLLSIGFPSFLCKSSLRILNCILQDTLSYTFPDT